MLNFDNSIARERLARNYAGVVDFGTGDFHSTSYLYSPKDYTIGGDTDYGGLKVFDSDKYIIKTPKFKSAYHMAEVELISSPLPDIPSTEKSQFNGADMNQFLSVPKDDLVLENYVGQEAQAEGLKSEEEFFVSQARKEVANSNLTDLDRFMRSSEIDDLITYKSSPTEIERGKKNKLPLGKTDHEQIDIPDVRLTGLTTKPAFDAKKILFPKNQDPRLFAEDGINQEKRDNQRIQAKRTERIMKRNDAIMEQHNNAKEREKENEKFVEQRILEQIQKDEARTKKQLERIEKKNVGKQSVVKQSVKEEKEENETGKGTLELGNEFTSSEKQAINKIITNLGIPTTLDTKELKTKLNIYLKQEYKEQIKGNYSNSNWFKKFLSIVEPKFSTPKTSKKPSKFMGLLDSARETPTSKTKSSKEISDAHDLLDLQTLGSLTKERK